MAKICPSQLAAVKMARRRSNDFELFYSFNDRNSI